MLWLQWLWLSTTVSRAAACSRDHYVAQSLCWPDYKDKFGRITGTDGTEMAAGSWGSGVQWAIEWCGLCWKIIDDGCGRYDSIGVAPRPCWELHSVHFTLETVTSMACPGAAWLACVDVSVLPHWVTVSSQYVRCSSKLCAFFNSAACINLYVFGTTTCLEIKRFRLRSFIIRRDYTHWINIQK